MAIVPCSSEYHMPRVAGIQSWSCCMKNRLYVRLIRVMWAFNSHSKRPTLILLMDSVQFHHFSFNLVIVMCKLNRNPLQTSNKQFFVFVHILFSREPSYFIIDFFNLHDPILYIFREGARDKRIWW